MLKFGIPRRRNFSFVVFLGTGAFIFFFSFTCLHFAVRSDDRIDLSSFTRAVVWYHLKNGFWPIRGQIDGARKDGTLSDARNRRMDLTSVNCWENTRSKCCWLTACSSCCNSGVEDHGVGVFFRFVIWG